jgi:hypothetical protein
VKDVGRGQQTGVEVDGLEVATEGLTHRDRGGEPAGLAQPATVRENAMGRAPPSVIT